MNILLTGGSGLLGSEFKQILTNCYSPTSNEMDITDFKSIKAYCKDKSINKIIHCAAYTNVDQAETDREYCFYINITGIQNLLKLEIPIIHFSSDYVFNAPINFEIPEDYKREPLNYYGKTKLVAEENLENSKIPFWNIRTSWLFGKTSPNFISKISDASKEKKTLSVVDDQIGRPTYASDLAKYVIENFIEKNPPSGHYHCQNTGMPVSWADLANFVLQKQNWNGVVKKIKTNDLHLQAKRPLNSILKNTKINLNLRSWNDAVEEYIENL